MRKKKKELLDDHFASQCSLAKSASTLPILEYKTDERLNSFEMDGNNIFSTINNLNASKAHG